MELESEPLTDDATVEQVIEAVDDGVGLDLPQSSRDDSGVPWVYTWSNVKDSQDMVQFYLREAVQNAKDDFVDAINDELGADVLKRNIRETPVQIRFLSNPLGPRVGHHLLEFQPRSAKGRVKS